MTGWCWRIHPIRVEQTASLLLLSSRKLVASKAAFLENYLVVSTWILNGSSIECHKKKHQPFRLSGVRFGSRAIQISGWKSARHWSSRKCAFHLWLLLTTWSKSQCKTHQITQIRHFEPQKFCNEQTVQVESIISNTSESLRISLDKTYAELWSMQMTINLHRKCRVLNRFLSRRWSLIK